MKKKSCKFRLGIPMIQGIFNNNTAMSIESSNNQMQKTGAEGKAKAKILACF